MAVRAIDPEICPRPFRWDLRRRASLGGLLEGKAAPAYPCFEDDLLDCATRVLAEADDSDLFFLGRSPESILDVLSGLLQGTTWERRLHHLPLSLWSSRTVVQERVLRAYLSANDLDPARILASPRPRAVCDLVASGATLGELVQFLHKWCWEERLNWRALRGKLRFICVVEDTMGASWCEEAAWPALLDRAALRHVSVPVQLWRYLADWQPKTAQSFTPVRGVTPRSPSRRGRRLVSRPFGRRGDSSW